METDKKFRFSNKDRFAGYDSRIIRVKLTCLSILLTVFVFTPVSAKADRMKGPWRDKPQTYAIPTIKESGQFNLLSLAVQLFRRRLSAVDGSRCQMYPTCSHYSLLAFKKHGLFMGYVMTIDRFIHEAEEWKYAPLIEKHKRWRVFDPVGANDYWWSNPS